MAKAPFTKAQLAYLETLIAARTAAAIDAALEAHERARSAPYPPPVRGIPASMIDDLALRKGKR